MLKTQNELKHAVTKVLDSKNPPIPCHSYVINGCSSMVDVKLHGIELALTEMNQLWKHLPDKNVHMTKYILISKHNMCFFIFSFIACTVLLWFNLHCFYYCLIYIACTIFIFSL